MLSRAQIASLSNSPPRMDDIPDSDWLIRGVTDENIKQNGDIKSGEFNTRELSVRSLSIESVEILLAHNRYRLLAPIKVEYCRQELGLEVRGDPEDIGHHVILLRSSRGSRSKKLRDFAQPLAVEVGSDASDIYDALRHNCDGYDSRGDD